MKIYLIRHAECQQNVGQATTTLRPHNSTENESNSGLTKDGKTQVSHLARYFRDNLVQFTRVFSSDLDRATDTAKTICQYQNQLGESFTAAQVRPGLTETPDLREQLFGPSLIKKRKRQQQAKLSLRPDGYDEEEEEGKESPYNVSMDDGETLAEMKSRADSFWGEFVLPLLLGRSKGNDARNSNEQDSKDGEKEETIAIVAHGVILQVLWVCLADYFNPKDIHFGPGLSQADFADQVAPIWSNTGFMELVIKPASPRGSGSVSVSPVAAAGIPLTPAVPHSSRGATAMAAPAPAPAPTPENPPLLAGWSMTILTIDGTTHLATAAAQTERKRGSVQSARNAPQQIPVDDPIGIPGTA